MNFPEIVHNDDYIIDDLGKMAKPKKDTISKDLLFSAASASLT
jgi:hypothetical protein